MRMMHTVSVFISFVFIYTIIWYMFTPVLDIILDTFSANVNTAGWTAEAVSTFTTMIDWFARGWVYICLISLLSTAVWLFIYPYREEVETRWN